MMRLLPSKPSRHLSFLVYPFLIGLALLLYYYREAGRFLADLAASDRGVLISLYDAAAFYFRHAEAWNYFFILLFSTFIIILFVLMDHGMAWVLDRAARRYPKLAFTRKPWFQLSIQKFLALNLIFLLFVVATNITIRQYGNAHSVEDPRAIEGPQPTLLLGTSKMLSSGAGENLYYRYRINAAIELWETGKVDYFIISGDRTVNDSTHYDEIRDMTTDLIALGVPASKIKADTAGFRTLDSILRLREYFRTNHITIVSQRFHVQRALFLAWFYGVQATGYIAEGTSTLAMAKRETLAKPKVVLDLFFLNTMPRITADGRKIEYREGFEVKTDLHIIFMFLLVVGFLTAFSAMKYGRSKKRKMVISITSVTLSIVILLQIYQTRNIEFLDQVVETVVESAGLRTEKMVEKNQREKEIKQQSAKQKIQEALGINDALILAEVENEISTMVDEIIAKEDAKNDLDSKRDDIKEQIEKSIVQNTDNREREESTVEHKEIKEKRKNILGNIAFNDHHKNSIHKRITLKVNGIQKVVNDAIIVLRAADEYKISGNILPVNSIVQAKANVFNGRVFLYPQKRFNGQAVFANEKGIPVGELKQTKRGDIVLTDGYEVEFEVE